MNGGVGVESDLFAIYDRFLNTYDGHLVSVTTSYKPLGTFYIKLDIMQLPHLLGLHKIYTGKNATQMIKLLASGNISTKTIRRHKNYGLIKDRIKYFGEFDTIISMDEDVQAILVAPADNQNTMRLDLVFQHVKSHRRISLGLRKTHDDVYAPVTFLIRQDRTIDYAHSKRLKYVVDGFY